MHRTNFEKANSSKQGANFSGTKFLHWNAIMLLKKKRFGFFFPSRINLVNNLFCYFH